ncbi:low molecular weight protein-tyrosine-phosphatase [Vibrio breoganii]|uniref:low molecular weight protein-tyrosine-phosphatase n=1 Tax=Vibrio breoganii TaxID=553239 RepID=UPI000C83307B|nr:low molecular weight protein-tyrosine-phosphatase [Vibrio breoganii]PMG96674.1 protein-tyrosine-phosphatase [Vibrio breoganii]PMI19463.1 protein-tyrosine-phosphatase [Vibrio breoganii]PMJ47458.1 protein-tyrosine-phosphatase [Vibrio breoganii]PMK57875.1 protein-tyrosine-phosphatase [Vibrio breoganii]PMK61207.1 protein-tyrosine-phosphatase [Vibrio breoganii]
MKILVVCMGNICRSPTAEAVLRTRAENNGLLIEVESAGTIDYHHGEKPDSRAEAAAKNRGYSFGRKRARGVTQEDFYYFDQILAADKQNLADLQGICPSEYQYKLALFLKGADLETDEIPDPYYGGEQGFERVLDLIESGSDKILSQL